MKITIVGVGMGNPSLLTAQAADAISESGLLVGARRILDCFPESTAERVEAATPEKIVKELLDRRADYARASVLVSGDVGFYSAARGLSYMLENEDLDIVCGISSLQYFCARLKIPWDDVKVVSLHGRSQNLLATVSSNRKTFVLTGGEQSAQAVCRMLCEADYAHLNVCVGERLSYPDERISTGDAEVLAQREFDPLAVLLVEHSTPLTPPATHGLTDERFLRGDVPMTKAEVRAVSVAKLRLKQGQTFWDVGAGTGSVSVEAARILYGGAVYAVERDAEALELLKQNKMRFSAHSMRIVSGSAPLALEPLPAPDAVFIGGGAGQVPRIVALALQKNPEARIVINAITLETASVALESFNRHGLCDQELVQVSVAKAKLAGGNHMMIGQNPVYILSAGGGKPADV